MQQCWQRISATGSPKTRQGYLFPSKDHSRRSRQWHAHTHVSKKNGKNIFNDPKGLYKLSKTALYFIGGILFHSASLSALSNPTSNSYRRLIAGLEAPSKAVFAEGNRSAAIRIPAYIKDPEERRFEFRPTDATCNPYLAFAALIMAGIDGVKKKIDPVENGFGPLESNLYDLSIEELKKYPHSRTLLNSHYIIYVSTKTILRMVMFYRLIF